MLINGGVIAFAVTPLFFACIKYRQLEIKIHNKVTLDYNIRIEKNGAKC